MPNQSEMYDCIHQETQKFEAQHRECIRVLPYKGEDSAVVVKLYVLTGADGISKSLREKAEDCFKAPNVKLEWIDLYNDPPGFLPVYSPSEFQTLAMVDPGAAAEIFKVISSNLESFDQHSNITAIHPSLKVKGWKQTSTPCIAVYVLGKGCVPLGEHGIVSEIGGYPVDVVDGFWSKCFDLNILDTQKSAKSLEPGMSIGTVKC